MRFSTSLATAILVAAIALPASSATVTHPKPKRQTGAWEVVRGEFAGRQTCMALGLADQSTYLTLKLDTGHMANHVIAILFGNTVWSIKEGDQLGEFEFNAGDQTAGAEPVAANHGFFFYMSLEPAQVWFDKTKAHGFSIERDGKEIARFKGGNLAETFRKILACGERLIKVDPFAQPAEAAPASRAPDAPSIMEPPVIPPKPINLGSWINLIQKDYFAGPVGGSELDLRHDRRNSLPASLQFKMAVDEHGTMAICEVVTSSGLSEWRDEFCSLAERHPLTFTPAISAAGKSVMGEYITSAVVAFE